MKILCIKHATFEQPGSIDAWAKNNGHDLIEIMPFDGDKLPNVHDYDMLVIMGGPQSPLKTDEYPYLRHEIDFIEMAIDENKPILGVCLGAQLIGVALGERAEHSPEREIGVFPVSVTEDGKKDPVFSQFPETFDVFHWHNDMTGIDDAMTVLATSAGCPRQAFRYGDRVYGVQCHLEVTQHLIEELIGHCKEDLKPGKYVKSLDELRGIDCTATNKLMDTLLDHLASL